MPLLDPLRQDGTYANYAYRSARTAMAAWRGDDERADPYLEAVRLAAGHVYRRLADDGATHFLDKTPRYHQIVELLPRVFPDAPIITLWRNPLAVAASMIRTWGEGRWNLHDYYLDLYDGLDRLTRAARDERRGNLQLRFEDLTADPGRWLAKIGSALGVGAIPEVTGDAPLTRLDGPLGDQLGQARWHRIVDRPDAWASDLATPVRRRWARSYLEWLGSDRATVMGYDLEAISRTLESVPLMSRGMLGDLAGFVRGAAANLYEPALRHAPRAAGTPRVRHL